MGNLRLWHQDASAAPLPGGLREPACPRRAPWGGRDGTGKRGMPPSPLPSPSRSPRATVASETGKTTPNKSSIQLRSHRSALLRHLDGAALCWGGHKAPWTGALLFTLLGTAPCEQPAGQGAFSWARV